MCAVTVASPNLRISQARRFECNSFSIWRKMRTPTSAFRRNDSRRRALGMLFVAQVQPPQVLIATRNLLVNELITVEGNGRPNRAHPDAGHRLRRSSRSRYTPQSRRTATQGSEHNIATVWSPSRHRIHPSVIEGQTLG